MADAKVSTGRARTRPRTGGRRRPSAGVRWIEATALAIVTVAVVVGALVGMVYVRLLHGPISLKPIAGLIEREIDAELAGLTTRIADVELVYGAERGLELRLAKLVIRERDAPADADVLVDVPMATVELSGPALRVLRLVPSRIDLIEPRLSLSYSRTGGLALDLRRGDPSTPAQEASAQEASAQGREAAAGPAPPAATPIDLPAVIAATASRARQRVDASGYLREIGVRDAYVTIDNEGARSEWRVLEGSVDLDHSRRESSVSVSARVASSRGPWSFVLAAVEGAARGVALRIDIADLHPRVVGLAMPQLSVLQPLDMPVTGTVEVQMAADGMLTAARATVGTGRGALVLPHVADAPLAIDAARLQIDYSHAERTVTIPTASLVWGESGVAFKGTARATPDHSGWAFALATDGGQLAAEEFGAGPFAITAGRLEGRHDGRTGETRIERLSLSAGGADLVGQGSVRDARAGEPGGTFEVKLGATTVDRLKAIWPRGIASGARTWIGERIQRGAIRSASLTFAGGSYARAAGVAGPGEPRRLSLALEAGDVVGRPLPWMSPIEAPRLLVRLENDAIEVDVPDASVAVGPGRKVAIKTGRFAAGELHRPAPKAEVTLRATAGLVPLLEILDQSPLKLLQANGLTTEGIDGKVDGQVKLTFPLIADLLTEDVDVSAKAKLTDGRAKQIGGAFDVQAAAIVFDVTPQAIDAQGDLVVGGVQTKLAWQRLLEETGEKQPPLRLSASLGNADRTQLGLDINHIVTGEVPVEVQVDLVPGGAPVVKVRADFTPAEVSIDALAWRKAPGRAAVLQADVVRGQTHKTDLQNLTVAGDDVALRGWAGIGADNRLREVVLEELTLNVISRLEVQAALKGEGDKGVWQVKVRGRTFDARELFQSFLTVGEASAAPKPAKPAGGTAKPTAGLDVDAEIDTVLGHYDMAIKGLKLALSRRGDKVTRIDARGTIDGKAPIAVALSPQPGKPRTLLADTTDAGQAFKLIGFYPNLRGGRGRLEVNVDGRGPAEKTGTLWVDDFEILGDPVLSEVLTQPVGEPGTLNAAPRRTAHAPRQVPERQSIAFDRMKIPFSVGYGQFVIEQAYLKGPSQGLELVGKIDFRQQTLNVGGTFIPLQGINNALGNVPLVGELLTPSGVFGVTFAVQGPIAEPQIIVNPVSAIIPGVFRNLMQMTNPNPTVTVREDKAPTAPVEKRVRASGPGPQPTAPTEPARATPPTQAASGWSTDGQPPPLPTRP